MSRLAQVDMVVVRQSLIEPGVKRSVRLMLYEELSKLGRVESIVRYVIDPPDGPYKDGTLAKAKDTDWDRNALVRLIGYVTPFSPSIPSGSRARSHSGGPNPS